MPLAMIDDILAIALCGFKSVAVNTFINTKTETKKLIFSDTKCKKLHVGCDNPFCPDLLVHGNVVNKTSHEKYLGDIVADTITGDGCNEKNISNRRSKGIGIIAQIMSILEAVSLGHHLFEIAMILRESIFINGILFNSEVWYSLTKNQIKKLEDVDKLLLRRFLHAPISTPCEALYLELGAIPISFILQARRLMFLHYLLELDREEMVSQFFYAQWHDPCKNDWTVTVQNDLRDYGIQIDLEEIKSMPKNQFKTLVKHKCRTLAFDHLTRSKLTHSKMSNLNYEEYKMQFYFLDKAFHSGDARMLFRFRTRMIHVKNNYKTMHKDSDRHCPVCKLEVDTQEHLLECIVLNASRPIAHVDYQAIFGEEVNKMKLTFNHLKTSLSAREKFISDEKLVSVNSV